MSKIRVRFAPSPTGPLHIGGARSALFNYLFAKKEGGDFIVRIEDTDLERSNRESEENIKDSLRWLGMDWNEGIDVGGPFAPYRQMERLDTYKAAVEQLFASGQAYYCYCSEAELEAEREASLSQKAMPIYSGKCRNLTKEERSAKEAAGIKPVIRLRVEGDEPIIIDDLVRGQVSFERAGIGDFVIVKSDGIPVYNFAVVVDDHTMNISHVLRGEEHLSNTPRQVVLYQALGWDMPQFGHISLILGKDKSKMSKRHGSVSVVNYKDQGFLPEALVNFLALLGWAPEGEREMFSLSELTKEFSLSRVSKSPAVFDIEKLKWLNGQYLHNLPKETIAEGIGPFVKEANLSEEQVLLLAETLQKHLNTFSEVTDYLPLFLGTENEPQNAEAAAVLAENTVPLVLKAFAEKFAKIEPEPENIKTILKEIRKENNLNGAQVFMAVRVALTGCQHGPDIHNLIALMGKENVAVRLAQTAKRVGQ